MKQGVADGNKEVRRCSLISIGLPKRHSALKINVQQRRRSAMRPSDGGLLLEMQSYMGVDDALSKTEPLPEKFIKQNIREPKERKRPS